MNWGKGSKGLKILSLGQILCSVGHELRKGTPTLLTTLTKNLASAAYNWEVVKRNSCSLPIILKYHMS